eukprot:COSAG02_NODE_844_length_16583_cov_116.650267_11_plen_121_part_00
MVGTARNGGVARAVLGRGSLKGAGGLESRGGETAMGPVSRSRSLGGGAALSLALGLAALCGLGGARATAPSGSLALRNMRNAKCPVSHLAAAMFRQSSTPPTRRRCFVGRCTLLLWFLLH